MTDYICAERKTRRLFMFDNYNKLRVLNRYRHKYSIIIRDAFSNYKPDKDNFLHAAN